MNDKSDPNHRQQQKIITDVISTVVIYAVSGALIIYGGVNVSLNALQCYRGMYTGHWGAAVPFVLLFGLASNHRRNHVVNLASCDSQRKKVSWRLGATCTSPPITLRT